MSEQKQAKHPMFRVLAIASFPFALLNAVSFLQWFQWAIELSEIAKRQMELWRVVTNFLFDWLPPWLHLSDFQRDMLVLFGLGMGAANLVAYMRFGMSVPGMLNSSFRGSEAAIDAARRVIDSMAGHVRLVFVTYALLVGYLIALGFAIPPLGCAWLASLTTLLTWAAFVVVFRPSEKFVKMVGGSIVTWISYPAIYTLLLFFFLAMFPGALFIATFTIAGIVLLNYFCLIAIDPLIPYLERALGSLAG